MGQWYSAEDQRFNTCVTVSHPESGAWGAVSLSRILLLSIIPNCHYSAHIGTKVPSTVKILTTDQSVLNFLPLI